MSEKNIKNKILDESEIKKKAKIYLKKYSLKDVVELIFKSEKIHKNTVAIEEINEANLQPIITDANTIKMIVNGIEVIYGNMDSCILIKVRGIT